MTTAINMSTFLALLLPVILLLLNLSSKARNPRVEHEHVNGNARLIVLVHGLLGRAKIESAANLAREALPNSDLMIFDYDCRYNSNADAYEIANHIEISIHEAHRRHQYSEIILVGHSMGGVFLRKALIWGFGLQDDRQHLGMRNRREWVKAVSRIVSLACLNRGWSISPRPRKMALPTYFTIWIGERLARLSRSGKLILAVQRGAAFIADTRVQWITLCRGELPCGSSLPQTIHLLGDRDDMVSREDSMDLAAAKDTIFVSLHDTGHREICTALCNSLTDAEKKRRSIVQLALQGQTDKLDIDTNSPPREDASVNRIIYIMHGIRDYGEWTDHLRKAINNEPSASGIKPLVVNKKYGHFPMLPFLFYMDRQKYVRLFMDEYTENKARFPNASIFDYIGHSNGTYILASALQRYRTLKISKVYFAGSVVPKNYKWIPLADAGRIDCLVNVVASRDWVVALFPRLFEQFAEWTGRTQTLGALDLGSAGFRGFEDSKDPYSRIENFQFADGAHGVGVDVANPEKCSAIVRYILLNEKNGLAIFADTSAQNKFLSFLSNICWLVWLLLAALFFAAIYSIYKINISAGIAAAVIILGLFYSV